MSLPYSDDYPIKFPKLTGAENYGEWLEGLRMAAATQPGIGEVLFGETEVQQPPDAAKFFTADKEVLPAPFEGLGPYLIAFDRLQAYNSANMRYQANQTQVARARELIVASVDPVILPLISEGLYKRCDPMDFVDHLATLFDHENLAKHRSDAITQAKKLVFPDPIHNNSSISILTYLSAFMQQRNAHNGELWVEGDVNDSLWCKRIVAGLTGPWKVLAKGLHPYYTSGDVTVLTRFLLQWDRIMPNLAPSANFISFQQVQYVEQVFKTYSGPPLGFFPVPGAANGDNSNDESTTTMNWILSFAETHLVVETERYFSKGTITPLRAPLEDQGPTAISRFVLGGGDASLKLTHVDPIAAPENVELKLKACLFVPDSALKENHISLPALQREGCCWFLDGTVMRVWNEKGGEILSAEIEGKGTSSKWVVTNVKGMWQL
jgi:hypothetical protein